MIPFLRLLASRDNKHETKARISTALIEGCDYGDGLRQGYTQ